MTDFHPSDSQLRLFLATKEELDPSICKHIEGCEQCNDQLSLLARPDSSLAAPPRRSVGGSGDSTGSYHDSEPNLQTISAHSGRLPSFPGYTTIDRIGRGGMGEVYSAQNQETGRIEALKTILPVDAASKTHAERFHTEIQAAAGVTHQNVVTVYAAGTAGSILFYSMEYCSGGTLKDKLKNGAMRPEDAVSLVKKVADAVAAIHACNIVHRDLKPGNILFTKVGEPKVSDFGLAKSLFAEDQTQTGAVFGTPAYMSPEQSKESKDVDHRTDIWALGVILYECLTGKVPFQATEQRERFRQIQYKRHDSSRLKDQLTASGDGESARWLQHIVDLCLQKQPWLRYQSAQELSEDLDRFLRKQPPKPQIGLAPTVRFFNRYPFAMAVCGLFLFGLLLCAAVALPLEVAPTTPSGLDTNNHEVTVAATANRQAFQAREKRDMVAFRQALNSSHPQKESWEYRFFKNLDQQTALALPKHRDGVRAVAINPAGRIATLDGQGKVRLFDSQSRSLGPLPKELDGPNPKSFAVDLAGNNLICAGTHGIVLYNLKSDETDPLPGLIPVDDDDIVDLALSEACDRAAVLIKDGDWNSKRADRLEIWRKDQGKWEDKTHEGHFRALALSGDGKSYAVVQSKSEDVETFDTETGKVRWTLKPGTIREPIKALALNRDATLIAVLRNSGVWLHRPGTAEGVKLGLVDSSFTACSLSADGKRVAVGGADGLVRVWDTSTPKLKYTLRGDDSSVQSIAINHDGTRIVSGHKSGNCVVWTPDTASHRVVSDSQEFADRRRTPKRDQGETPCYAAFDDLSWGVTVNQSQLIFWEQDSGIEGTRTKVLAPPALRGSITCVAMNKHEADRLAKRQIAIGYDSGAVQVLDIEPPFVDKGWTLEKGCEWLQAHDGKKVISLAFSPDGTSLVSGGQDHMVNLYDVRRPEDQPKPLHRHAHPVRSVKFSPDGKRILSGSGADPSSWPVPGEVKVWDASTATEEASFTGHNATVTAVAFSTDNRAFSGGSDGSVMVWDFVARKHLATFSKCPFAVTSLCMRDDGTRVVIGCADGVIRLRDVRTGIDTLELPHGSHAVRWVAADKSSIFAGGDDGIVKCWTTTSGAGLAEPE